MNLKPSLITDRLSIKPLTKDDGDFILKLLNTEGWLRFIGNRNVTALSEADSYIQKIIANAHVSYWVVSGRHTEEKMGIVTYIKREYLEYPDIGFAFLPAFCNKGYAYEATSAILNRSISDYSLPRILATTIPENIASIKLLKRIGLNFEEEINVDNNKLHIYAASTDMLNI